MGWDFGIGQSRKDMVAYLTKSWTSESGVKHICIASRSARSQALWAVWDIDKKDPHIVCYLTKRVNYGTKRDPIWSWGNKAMSESMGPYCYSCPLKYLDMVPVACSEWREKVLLYWRKRNRKVEKGQVIKLEGSTIPYVKITSVRPLWGFYNGRTYRVPRKMLGELI